MRALIAALEALRHPKPEFFRSLWSGALLQLCQSPRFSAASEAVPFHNFASKLRFYNRLFGRNEACRSCL